jgi:hypothetical protein
MLYTQEVLELISCEYWEPAVHLGTPHLSQLTHKIKTSQIILCQCDSQICLLLHTYFADKENNKVKIFPNMVQLFCVEPKLY